MISDLSHDLIDSQPDDVSEELFPDALVDALGGLGLDVEDEGEDAVHPVPDQHLVLGVRLQITRYSCNNMYMKST